MELVLIVVSMVITLLAAALTVPAGFGLATMLTPVVLFWLPPHEAIAVVAIIHGAHNAWKFKLLKASVDFSAVKRYGWALIIGAIIGAVDLTRIPIYIMFEGSAILDEFILIPCLVISAILGVNLGKRWLTKWKQSVISTSILIAIVASGVMYIVEATNNLGYW